MTIYLSVFSVFSVVPLQLSLAWVPAFAGMSGSGGRGRLSYPAFTASSVKLSGTHGASGGSAQ
jgi:hypothetical protein